MDQEPLNFSYVILTAHKANSEYELVSLEPALKLNRQMPLNEKCRQMCQKCQVGELVSDVNDVSPSLKVVKQVEPTAAVLEKVPKVSSRGVAHHNVVTPQVKNKKELFSDIE